MSDSGFILLVKDEATGEVVTVEIEVDMGDDVKDLEDGTNATLSSLIEGDYHSCDVGIRTIGSRGPEDVHIQGEKSEVFSHDSTILFSWLRFIGLSC